MKNVSETIEKKDRPVRILQYGEGNFLRAFVDWIVDILNEKSDFNGSVMQVQPLKQGMGDMINAQNGIYTTVLRGVQNGKPVEEFRKITSVKGCLNPYVEADYEKYMQLAESPDLRFIISNTTEAGIAYHEGDKLEDKPQVSYPGKVCAFLYHRYKAFNGAEDKGIIAIPCELIDKNGDNLKKIVKQYAEEWKLEEGFIRWLDTACDFCNSLVDRIVPGYPRAEADSICERLGYKDNLLDAAEIFLLWVIECHGKTHEDEFPTQKAGVNVIWTDDVKPYKKRKVRILNGAHTSTVLAAYLAGYDIVMDFMKDDTIRSFMNTVIYDEVIPTLDLPKEELEDFAAAVNDRFANPYIKHKLLDIALNSCSKFNARCLPSLLGYVEEKGELPKCLTFSLAAFIRFYKGQMNDGVCTGVRKDGTQYQIRDDADVLTFFAEIWTCNDADKIAGAALSNTSFWSGKDLTQIPGLKDAVAGYLKRMDTEDIRSIMTELIG